MRRAGVVVLALLAVTAGASNAAPVATTVFFVQGEGLKGVTRQLPKRSVSTAVAAMLRGPTAAEKKLDVRTQVPRGTALRTVTVRSGVATVDLTRAYVEGTKGDSLKARLVQLVWTATGVPGVTGVRLWIDGRAATSLGQGVMVNRLLTRSNLDPPNAAFLPPITVVPDRTGPAKIGGVTVKWLQQRLVDLSYLPPSARTGHFGPWTRSAVLAFQGWEELGRDGVPGPKTIARLKVAKHPTPAPGAGKRIEVRLGAQVALLVNGSRVTRVIKVSTGKPGYDTPLGSYAIYRKHLRDWSYPYSVWLPYASYFVGGIAFHEWPEVPGYPASHGCVRVPRDDAATVYAFAALKTRVVVLR